jgi:hypothetical protein
MTNVITHPRPLRPRQDIHAYRPCCFCGRPVLSGQTLEGVTVHLEPAEPCYDVGWPPGAEAPLVFASTAYPLHVCSRRRDVGTIESRGEPHGPK